ncbi:hypothetical protein NG796_12710 [Laspinema sp. A4]|uniref:hypothetical protein n=1 Tax=Laspinema sp. D2d TaxID=2953686 RepID=UPI0021BABE3F|nr:hypothetical protein [Laspinema sp. D2d]MCT7984157.1 hypothetical protein [Laspinema sp. D2d]
MSEPSSNPKSPLGFDEIIAIFVAFSTLGTIFILSFPSTERGLNIFETGTSAPTSEKLAPGEQTPQTPVNSTVNPGQVPAVGPQSTNPATSPQGNSTAWGGLALPFFSPNPNGNPTEAPTGEGSTEVTSPSDETPTLSSPTTEETLPTESGETPKPTSSPSATPTDETPTLSSPTTEETLPTESGKTPKPTSSPSTTPTTEGKTDSTPKP